MNQQPAIHWFAVHTKRFREALAVASLGSLGLEVFLPMVKVDSPENQVIKVATKPLFPAYIFARFDSAAWLDSVEAARGVSYVVKSGAVPIPVDDGVVREIQDRAQEDGLIRLQPRKFKPGDRVSIQEGPFMGMMGRVEAEFDDCKRVAILMEALWGVLVHMENRWLALETV